MRDWSEVIRERLAAKPPGAQLEPEVVRELADYLEDLSEERSRSGIPAVTATDVAAAEVRNWSQLARRINEARGGTMRKQRILAMWLPGVVNCVMAFLLLGVTQKFASLPRIVSAAPRISSMLYLGWLLLLPALGAAAARWSSRAGGSLANRFIAAILPAGSLLSIFLVIVTSGAHANHGLGVPNLFQNLLNALIGAVVLPALALMVGAAPFLWRRPELKNQIANAPGPSAYSS